MDNQAVASNKRLALASKDTTLAAPIPGTDSDPTIGGALLELANPTTGETATIVLPAENWTRSRRTTYKYSDDTCDRLIVRPGRIAGRCRGAGIGLSLDEPSQGSLAVRLILGGKDRYCILFGGQIRKDSSASATRVGRFISRNAPAPATCPVPPLGP